MEIIKTLWGLFIAIINAFWKIFVAMISNPFYVTIIIIIILEIIIRRIINLLYPKFKGYVGELWVRQELKKLPKNNYRIVNDVMIKQNGLTHQIDHLVISQFGIFVIEVKNYSGLISGNDVDNKWTQSLGKNKSYFLNPIHQNYGHVKALEELLNLDNEMFVPIVCFSESPKLEVETKNIVVPLKYLILSIKSYKDVILEADLDMIYNRIVESNIVDRKERRAHVRKVRDKISENEEKVENMICPNCGNNLVIRNGKHGTFIGCSNYPKCKFVRN